MAKREAEKQQPKSGPAERDQFEGMYITFLARGPSEDEPEDYEQPSMPYVAVARLGKTAADGRSMFDPLLAFSAEDGSLNRRPQAVVEYWGEVDIDDDGYSRIASWRYPRFPAFSDAYVHALGLLAERQRQVRVAA